MSKIPERCFSVTWVACGGREGFDGGFRCRAYRREKQDHGLWIWVEDEWLGQTHHDVTNAYFDGRAAGLPHRAGIRCGALAMTVEDLLPDWAQSAIRLGWPWGVTVDYLPKTLNIVIDNEIATTYGPFAEHDAPQLFVNHIRLLLEGVW